MNGRPLVIAIALSATGVIAPSAQEPVRTFQFVSIRFVPGQCPNLALCIGTGGLLPSSAPSSISVLPGGRFEARNQTFENLARVAFGFEGVDPRRGVVDTPRFFWPDRDRFDITAAIDGDWSAPPPGEGIPAELRPMLRTLLEERFHMKAHVETRNVDVFAVTLSNRDGEPGPGLRTSDDDCLGPYTDPPADTPKPACAFRLESNRVEAGAVTMPEVARLISRIPGFNPDRVIVDGTGMPGRYDVLLSIDIPGNVRTVSPRNDASSADGSFVAAAGLQERRPIAIREALQQQLGLKLEKAKLPIPTLIIERAKKPEED